jgi:hypothetical protein
MGFACHAEMDRWYDGQDFRLSLLPLVAHGPVWEPTVEDDLAFWLGQNRSIRQNGTLPRRRAGKQTEKPKLNHS